MTRRARFRLVLSVAAGLCLALVLGGCVIRPTGTPPTAAPVYVSQPQPFAVAQPLVVQPAPIVVRQPPIVVYRPAPSPVRTPVRVYAGGVPIRPVGYPVYSGYSSPVYPAYGYPCVPGTTRVCEAYCGSGYQVCSSDGSGWGGCIESYSHYEY